MIRICNYAVSCSIVPVTIGVVKGVVPHLILAAPILISSLTYPVRLLPDTVKVVYSSLATLNSSSRMERVVNLIHLVAAIGKFSLLVLPIGLKLYLLIEAVNSLSLIIGSATSVYKGVRKIKTTSSANMSLSRKIVKFISGSFYILIGMMTTKYTIEHSYKMIRGMQLFRTLSPGQQHFVIKHKVLHTLSDQKTIKAVVIDGSNSQWGNFMDDCPDPQIQAVYEHADTRTYQVNSSNELAQVMENASKEFGGKSDVLAFVSHANPESMFLGEHYAFTANIFEASVIHKHLSSNGQLFFLGCNTAGKSSHSLNLVEKVMKRIQPLNRVVVGVKDLFFPRDSLLEFNGTNFDLKAYRPFSFSNDAYVLPSIKTDAAMDTPITAAMTPNVAKMGMST